MSAGRDGISVDTACRTEGAAAIGQDTLNFNEFIMPQWQKGITFNLFFIPEWTLWLLTILVLKVKTKRRLCPVKG